MTFSELKIAIVDAFRRKDYDQAFSLLDRFIDSASSDQLASALSLKAELIMRADPRRSPEGLLLVDEAIKHHQGAPGGTMGLLVNALGLCVMMGDVEKARRYEAMGHRLLQEFPDDQIVQAKQFRLHFNLGFIAQMRSDLASAYWHFMQAVASLAEHGTDDDCDIRSYFFRIYESMIEVCLEMGRGPEAEDNLQKARDNVTSQNESRRWAMARARVLLFVRRPKEAEEVLTELRFQDSSDWPPAETSRYYLLLALVAEENGDLRSYHSHLSHARRVALENSLDYMVCEIQRIQRTPFTQGVAR